MSIARMKKLSVIGHSSVRAELMKRLMTLGVVEISSQDEKLTDSEWKELVSQDGNEGAASRYDNWIGRTSQALDVISKFGTEKKPLLKTRKQIGEKAFEEVLKDKHSIEKKVEQIASLSNKLSEINAAQNKAETNRLSLLPWKGYDIPLEIQGTKETDVIIGVIPSVASVDSLKGEVAAKTENCLLELVNSDAEQHYIMIVCLKRERTELEDVLKVFGFNRTQFGEMKGTVEKNITTYDEMIIVLTAEKAMVQNSISKEAGERQSIEYLHDSLVMKRNQNVIRNRLLVTKQAFYLDGWVPRAAAVKVEELLKELECYYELEDPAKGEDTPVLLLNGRFSSPFESITRLYALPGSRGIDATPFFSLSYAIFFGLMLSDAAYGVIVTVATFMMMKKFKLEGMAQKLIQLFFYCGISTIVWGVLFGGYFGDLITVVAKTFFNAEVTIPALWFNPMADPMKLLMFSFILGGIHLFIGMGLNGYMSIKDGRPWDAVFDIGLWYILLIGLVLLLTGIGAPVGQWMSIIAAVGILITGGRHNKGIGKITGGLGSLYGITGYLSDVLSYSRLLALGLATGVIASVVNTMGTLAGGGIIGLILLIVAFVVGHGYNLAINGLGAFVHSCRLEYVEFFGKFYESGGEAFEPFAENTKYIEILREEI